MMKRIAAVLVLCLLLPACSLAFDLSTYEVPGSGRDFGSTVTPISPGSALVSIPSMAVYLPDAAALVRDGRIAEEFTSPYDPELLIGYAPYLTSSGMLGAVRSIKTKETYGFNPDGFALYDVEDGRLVNERIVEGEPTSFAVHDGAFVGLREREGESALLMLYDENGRIRYTYHLPSQRAWLQSICPDGSELMIMLELWDGIPERQMLSFRIAADGRLLWQLWHKHAALGGYSRILRSGDGGAFLIASSAEDYKIKQVARLSHDGQILWEKSVSASKAVLNINATIPHPETNTVTLVGTAIANSRKLYDAFAMEIDMDGHPLALDVRDFSARGDYNFSCKLDQNDAPYAVSDSLIFPKRREGEKSVIVPFFDLPAANDPGIQIR